MKEKANCFDCIVKSLTCFNELNPESISFLNNHKIISHYKKGQTVFHEGTWPQGIFCLKAGKIKIYRIGTDGKEQIVRFVTPGDLLGIRALIAGMEYSASAETIEASVICNINRPIFIKLIDENPGFSHCLMKILSKLLEDAERKMTSLAQKPVRERLAETLVIMRSLFQTDPGNENNSKISLSRNDLANIVGTATETVIRLLSEFKDENLISINGRSITLIDIDGLKKAGKVFD